MERTGFLQICRHTRAHTKGLVARVTGLVQKELLRFLRKVFPREQSSLRRGGPTYKVKLSPSKGLPCCSFDLLR